jgi:hypothetical protein
VFNITTASVSTNINIGTLLANTTGSFAVGNGIINLSIGLLKLANFAGSGNQFIISGNASIVTNDSSNYNIKTAQINTLTANSLFFIKTQSGRANVTIDQLISTSTNVSSFFTNNNGVGTFNLNIGSGLIVSTLLTCNAVNHNTFLNSPRMECTVGGIPLISNTADGRLEISGNLKTAATNLISNTATAPNIIFATAKLVSAGAVLLTTNAITVNSVFSAANNVPAPVPATTINGTLQIIPTLN